MNKYKLKKHEWFSGFDWDNLTLKTHNPPYKPDIPDVNENDDELVVKDSVDDGAGEKSNNDRDGLPAPEVIHNETIFEKASQHDKKLEL